MGTSYSSFGGYLLPCKVVTLLCKGLFYGVPSIHGKGLLRSFQRRTHMLLYTFFSDAILLSCMRLLFHAKDSSLVFLIHILKGFCIAIVLIHK